MRNDLFNKANVVGVADGTKWRGGVDTEEHAIVVFVGRKLPREALSADEMIPDQDPDERLPTDVWEVGHLVKKPLRSFMRPCPPGASIGPPAWSGTLGAYLEYEGRWYALSNNHVLVRHQNVEPGDPIFQPGGADQWITENIQPFAKIDRYVPIRFGGESNRVDAALAEVINPDHVERWSTYTGELKPRIIGPLVGWEIQKVGRTSGYTTDKVIARNATVEIDFGEDGVARFVRQIVTGHMLDSGDSGSLGVSSRGNPFALGFAGSDTISLWNPLGMVFGELGFTGNISARLPAPGVAGM